MTGGLYYPQWQAPLAAELHRSWSRFLVAGILLIALGVIGLIYAVGLTYASVFVFGLVLIFAGVTETVLGFWARKWSNALLNLLGGILSVLVGSLFVAYPNVAAITLTLLLGTLLVVGGTFRAVGSAMTRFPYWEAVLVNGLIGVLLGILILAQWPQAAAWVIGLFIGIDLIVRGLAFLALSVAAHKIPSS